MLLQYKQPREEADMRKALVACVILLVPQSMGSVQVCPAIVLGIFDMQTPAVMVYQGAVQESLQSWDGRGVAFCNAAVHLYGAYNGKTHQYHVSMYWMELSAEKPESLGRAQFSPEGARASGCDSARRIAAHLSLRNEIRVDSAETRASAFQDALSRMRTKVRCE